VAVAEFFLKEFLPPMPYGHHGRAIVDIFPDCVEIDGFSDYYESRFLKTSMTNSASRIKGHSLIPDEEEEESVGIVKACNLIFSNEEIKYKLFEKSESES
jgi:hypothetical protein